MLLVLANIVIGTWIIISILFYHALSPSLLPPYVIFHFPRERIQAQMNILKRKLTEKKLYFLYHRVNFQRAHEMDIVHCEMIV